MNGTWAIARARTVRMSKLVKNRSDTMLLLGVRPGAGVTRGRTGTDITRAATSDRLILARMMRDVLNIGLVQDGNVCSAASAGRMSACEQVSAWQGDEKAH